MSQAEGKAAAAAAWDALRPKNSSIKARAEGVLQRAYGRAESPAPAPKLKKSSTSTPPEWMISLGMVPKKKNASAEIDASSSRKPDAAPKPAADSEEVRKAAAAALAAAKSGSSQPKVATSSPPPQSDAAIETGEKRKLASGLDSLLEQIQKKSKGNILDKSRSDWGEFKEEKGLNEELEAYKKSGGKYLDKVAFLQRADDREFEKERDARLEYQAKRRSGASYQED